MRGVYAIIFLTAGAYMKYGQETAGEFLLWADFVWIFWTAFQKLKPWRLWEGDVPMPPPPG